MNENIKADKAFARVAQDLFIETAGMDSMTIADKTEDTKRQKMVKLADYNGDLFLGNAIGYRLDDNFSRALSLQSKRPMYSLEDPGVWWTKDTEGNIKIEKVGDDEVETLFTENKNDITISCLSRDINEMIENDTNSYLTYIFFILKSDNKGANGYLGGIENVAYVFESTRKDSDTPKYDIVRNTINQSSLLKGCYFNYTVCNTQIVRWDEINGAPEQSIIDPKDKEEKIQDAHIVKITIGQNKTKTALMINCNPSRRNRISPKKLSTCILAVQGLRPKSNQLKKDLSPEWVAKRIPFNEYGVASEDVTLVNGQNYYWDEPTCWKIRMNPKDDGSRKDTRREAWYWEMKPFLKGGSRDKTKKADNKDLMIEPSDVTVFDGTQKIADTPIQLSSTSVMPDVVAKKAYGVMVECKDFQHSGFKSFGQQGVYFQNSQGGSDGTYTFHDVSIGGLEDDSNGNYTWKNGTSPNYVNEADMNDITCFYNEQSKTPTNGYLIEAKEPIFDVYFFVKGRSVEDEAPFQYEIPITLKNGKKIYYDTDGKKIDEDFYYPGVLKEICKGSYSNADKIKEEQKNNAEGYKQAIEAAEEKGYIEEFELTQREINKDDSQYKHVAPGVYKRWKKDLPTTNPFYRYRGCIVEQLPDTDTDYDVINPLDTLPCTKHFSYIKATELTSDGSGGLTVGTYLLVFGYNQERITADEYCKPIWEKFKEKFKDLNRDSLNKSQVTADTPWWVQQSESIYLNEAFVKRFFETEEEVRNRVLAVDEVYRTSDLKATTFKDEDLNVDIELTEDYITDLNTEIKSIIESADYKCGYVDSYTDYICDRFYEMVCSVWGSTDSDGIRRTKNYYVKGTPFEMFENDENASEEQKKSGFDARVLLEQIIAQTICGNVQPRYISQILIKDLQNFFSKNKNINLANADSYKSLIDKVGKSIQDCIKSSAKVGLADCSKTNELLIKRNNSNAIWSTVYNISTGAGLTVALGAAAVGAWLGVHALVAAGGVSTATAILGAISSVPVIGSGAGMLSTLIGSTAFLPVLGIVLAAAVITAVVLYGRWVSGRNKATGISDDYCYHFTCRAKRALRLYSITKRGPFYGPSQKGKLEDKDDKTGKTTTVDGQYGDFERLTQYYNWLAEPGKKPDDDYAKAKWDCGSIKHGSLYNFQEGYDGRVAVIFPTTDEVLSDSDAYSIYSTSALQNVESFIHTWMGKSKRTAIAQTELPIQGYYDTLAGMHPWIEARFRMGLGVCGRKMHPDGSGYLFYDEHGVPFLFKQKQSDGGKEQYFKVAKNADGAIVVDKNSQVDDAELKKLLDCTFKTLNSNDYPYFKGLSIVDNGVKSLTLSLYDPNFGSYTTGIDKGKGSEEVMSLETLLRAALRNPKIVQEDTLTKYNENGSGELKGDYLEIDESLVVSPTNLQIRFGYDDLDPMAFGTSVDKEAGSIANNLNNYYDTGNGILLSAYRNGRWYDVESWGSKEEHGITHLKKYIKDKEIQNVGGDWISVGEISGNQKDLQSSGADGDRISNNATAIGQKEDANLAWSEQLKSFAQTTKRSRLLNFMITGFSSSLKDNGIHYEIKAIETKDANIMRTRFLQRYAEISANPEEVLYILMHMFNETNDGENVSNSKVKIILLEDDSDDIVISMKERLNMEYDLTKVKESEFSSTTFTNLYEQAYSDEAFSIKESWLKKITLSLGSAAATRNYGPNGAEPYIPLYKTLSQLMNEFCSACPPKKFIPRNKVVDPITGENILANQENTAARPLKWFSVEDKANDTTYICLYYRSIIKVPRIRVYTWGPNNPTPSCVKSINIKNENEFAILSAVNSFDPRKRRVLSRNSSGLEQETLIKEDASGSFDYIGNDASKYDEALSNCMYKGSMEILGDPFWLFEGPIQPCTCPIKLNIVMPQSEFTRYAEAKKTTGGIKTIMEDGKPQTLQYDQQIENLKKQWGSRDLYRGSWDMIPFKNPYEPDKEQLSGANGYFREKVNGSGNQVLHEMSGYYVVNSIKHNITPSSYTTTLEILSYPNIQKDVLLTKTQYDALK